MRTIPLLAVALIIGCSNLQTSDYPIQPVPFTAVQITEGFWKNRLETSRTVTIPFAFKKCEETGRISNFEVAGGLRQGEFRGIYFDDSDVYKIIEGAAYSLTNHADPALEAYLDGLITKIAAAQEPDGYLYTCRTIAPDHPKLQDGGRWGNLKDKHELYNVGHLYEAAVAYYRATGKRTLLDVAIKNADMVDSVFGPGKNMGVPGHEEIEIGLAKLYRTTGDGKYLNLAKFFLDQRGNAAGHELYGENAQDHIPVVQQTQAVGHSVRAGYLYSGMADVAALKNDPGYIRAIGTIWEDIVTSKMYLTGGIGASRSGEKFGDAYDLPNLTGYNETCAAIANMMLNHRLSLLHGDSKYMDVFERVLYNGFLSGVSLDGDTFFYPNPLSSDGKYEFNHGHLTRSPWFTTSCCPANVSRVMPSLSGYLYATRGDSVFINLFMNSMAQITTLAGNVRLEQKTNYPWSGKVDITLVEAPGDLTLLVRIPGWARNQPAPGDLYHYIDDLSPRVMVAINGASITPEMRRGYAVLSRTWQSGDRISLEIEMPVRRVVCNEKVNENAGRIAVERGPLVYCCEGVDNGGHVLARKLSPSTPLVPEARPNLLGGLTVVRAGDLLFIPYYSWSHRGPGEMAVWLKNEDLP